MKKVSINSDPVLKKFLKIVAKESVSKSYDDILRMRSDDEKSYQEKLAGEMKAFSKGSGDSKKKVDSEADDDSESDSEGSSLADDLDDSEPTEQQPDDVEGDSGDSDDDSHEIAGKDVTFGLIKDMINTVRSGKSLKDKPTRMNLKKYFLQLDDPEKIALYKFLKGIAAIITAGIESDDAAEPSDDPDSVRMIKNNGGSGEDSTEDVPDEDDQEEKKKKHRSGEDTSPPISVGNQTMEAIRKRVRDLMIES